MHDSTNGPTQRYCRSWIQWFKELGVVLFRNCCRIKVRQRGGAATQDPTARRAATQDPTVRGEATQDPTARGELRPVIMEVRGGGGNFGNNGGDVGNSLSPQAEEYCTSLTPRCRAAPVAEFVMGKYIFNVCAQGRVD